MDLKDIFNKIKQKFSTSLSYSDQQKYIDATKAMDKVGDTVEELDVNVKKLNRLFNQLGSSEQIKVKDIVSDDIKKSFENYKSMKKSLIDAVYPTPNVDSWQIDMHINKEVMNDKEVQNALRKSQNSKEDEEYAQWLIRLKSSQLKTYYADNQRKAQDYYRQYKVN